MKRLISTVLVSGLAFTLTLSAVHPASAAADDTRRHRIETPEGTWRGQVNERVEVKYMNRRVPETFVGVLIRVEDSYIVLKGDSAEKTLFRDDIVSMNSVTAPAPVAGKPESRPRMSTGPSVDPNAKEGPGVFYLPMEGPCGESFRHVEIKKMGEHADKYGPGQIIIMKISSYGGLVLEAEEIARTITEVRKRHRVIAWIDRAISAGAWTAMCCDEIYFQRDGVAGSVTTIAGGRSISEQQMKTDIDSLVKIAVDNGMSEHVARAMKLTKYQVSYDKDPVTGDVTWYGDLSGEYQLSNDDSNLCFNSDNAEHSGFSSGTADTKEELAKLLDLPRWRTIDDKGEELAKDWQDWVARAKEDLPILLREYEYKGTGSGDPLRVLNERIKILKKVLRYYKEYEWACMSIAGVPKEPLEEALRQLEEQKRQLARRR